MEMQLRTALPASALFIQNRHALDGIYEQLQNGRLFRHRLRQSSISPRQVAQQIEVILQATSILRLRFLPDP